MEDTVKTRHNPLAWFGKHKKLTALLLVVLIAAVLVLRAVLGGKKAAGSTYQFVRTSTLQKTSLTDSVSVNGTVKSRLRGQCDCGRLGQAVQGQRGQGGRGRYREKG